MATRKTIKLLILLIAASIAYSLESFTCDKTTSKADSSMFKTKEGENLYLEAYDKALSLWPLKYEEHDLKTSFGKVHVIISGPERGNPLVLLHGMNASSTMWYPNIKALSEKYRTYAIDYIAEPNKSVATKGIKNIEDVVKCYDEVFNELHLDKFSIIGASRGGWLTVQLALHMKNRINSIILLSPAQTFSDVKPKKEILKNIFFSFFPERENFKSTLKTLSSNPDKLEKLYVDQYLICLENMKKETGVLKMKPFSKEELRSLDIPVLVLIGDNDIINNKKSIERAKKLIPRAETEMVSQSGHFVSFDQAEIVNARMLQFLHR